MAFEEMILQGLGLGWLGGMIAGLFMFVLIVGLAVYIYSSLALMTIAKKAKVENGWLAFIPIANVYLMTQIAKLPGWYTLAILLPLIPAIGPVALMVVMAYFWWKICEQLGKPGWWGVLTLIPVVNLVIMGMLAWGK